MSSKVLYVTRTVIIFANMNSFIQKDTALTEEVKVAKARNKIILDESTDTCISNSSLVVDGGRKANTAEEIDAANSRLRMRDIVGVPNRGRERLSRIKAQSNIILVQRKTREQW